MKKILLLILIVTGVIITGGMGSRSNQNNKYSIGNLNKVRLRANVIHFLNINKDNPQFLSCLEKRNDYLIVYVIDEIDERSFLDKLTDKDLIRVYNAANACNQVKEEAK